ncbi:MULTISPECIES: dicarboxylate/amino acid:cation symporter [Dickeya]|uniref:Dicarboxylate/amino acid:cation symporter n=1 Tax=Dickeya oryzae TaxID=1240404 RepID=A0AB39IX26_9GAMM|nr:MULTISPECIES: dicarboxylate/amino acid:cation symporter [Dickeya]AJC65852.1 amino acid:proton symporter [Dickeya zeae EC1]PXW44671.1 Na+/H+-dicarboxylate symporter [Erwinia sp. AG740]MBP2851285.1 dicarboxylate/amino acid:cation symporter [Dickeya oryzae]MBP2858821.1 dicarboxylate/amino acid:cation symporter [Dickeya oryzae]MCA6992173.1 dicarboxylate/amino acid:cation symporter [Dickeya oryzae]
MQRQKLLIQIMLAIVLGILIGWACHTYLDGARAKEVASYFNMVTDIFLRLIKMIIAPLVFATLVSGLASMGNSSAVGRVGLKAMTWFVTASFLSLLIGMMLANFFQPGTGMNLVASASHVTTGLNTDGFTLKNFISHIFPKSIIEAMANNEILQILVFSLFFGSALAYVKHHNKQANFILSTIEELAKVMFRVTDYVMALAPIAVFAAIGSAITTQGLGLIYDFGKLIGEFYLGLALLWAVLFLVGYAFLGRSIAVLARLIREPTMLAFATASSESAYPKTMDALTRFGVPKKITSFVLPLGYSFNLDGSMMYQSFAILFIAQAYNIDLSMTQQILILLTLMITSKGMAGVARASVVVVAATLPMFNLPEAGILLILGIDQFLDMGRTATNVIGNSISTAVVASLEKDITDDEEETEPEVVLQQARQDA